MEKYILINNKKFYYTEVELFHGRKKIDKDIAKENLQIFHSIIEKTDIKYGLMFGTLLGAIREKEFIEYDEDIDIYVLSEFRESFLRLLIDLKDQGFELVRIYDDLYSIMRKDEYIDIYFFNPKLKFGIKKLRVCSGRFAFDSKHLENPINIMFLDMDISIPREPERLLKKMYGKNWNIPIENKNARPNMLHLKIFSVFPFITKVPFYSFFARIYKKSL